MTLYGFVDGYNKISAVNFFCRIRAKSELDRYGLDASFVRICVETGAEHRGYAAQHATISSARKYNKTRNKCQFS